MKKESALPRLPLGVHKLFNYLLLPVSIGYGVYASYMHLEPLMAFSLKSFLDALLLVCLLFPFSSVLLDTITFFTLLGYHRVGRKNVMFTSTFKALVAIVSMVASFLSEGSFLNAAIYLLIAGIYLIVYLYYLPRARFFPKGGTSYQKMQRNYAESLRIMMEVMNKPQEEKTETVEESGEEAMEEEEESEKEAPLPPMVRDRSPEADTMSIKKKSIITTGSFYLEEPLFVKEIRLELLDGITGIAFDVFDRSDREYVEAEWLINGKFHYVTETNFFPGDKTTIKAELTEYEDRLRVELLSVTDTEGNKTVFQKKEETEVYLPPQKLLKDMDEDPEFQSFLHSYIDNTHLNAKYCTTANMKDTALLCPVCGSPILPSDRWCPICGITRNEVLLFQEETILSAFHASKDEEKEDLEQN